MVSTVEFGNIDAARKVRKNPQFQAFISDEDVPQSKTVTLSDQTPQSALDDITGKAADSKSHEADKAGQASLSRQERKDIDFSRESVNVPKVRSIKAIAGNVGVTDYLQFADLTLTVDENRRRLKQAAKEEQGRSGMGRDDMSDERIDQRLASAFNEQRENQADRAKQFALVDTDQEAQDFVSDMGFDIGFTRTDDNRLRGQGADFERLKERHESRSERAQTMDEKRSAKTTRDPVQWTNNPAQYDYPGIDTVQPRDLHEQRTERAQEVDERELAPPADTKEQWALNQDEFDWPGVDTPPKMGLGPNQEREETELPDSEYPKKKPAASGKKRFNLDTGDETIPASVVTERQDFDQFGVEMQARDVSLSPDEAFRGVGATSSRALGGNFMNEGERAPSTEPEAPPEEALQEQSEGVASNFTDDRDSDSQLLDFGMETDATQHRESRTAEEQATTFGVDDRDDASRGTSNDSDSGEQGGLERFGGGTRENETLF